MKKLSSKAIAALVLGTVVAVVVAVKATAADSTATTPTPDSDMHHHWQHDGNKDGGWGHNGHDGAAWGHNPMMEHGGWGHGPMGPMGPMGMMGMMHHHHNSIMETVAGLDLTADQRAKLEPIMKAEQAQIKAIQEQAHNQIKALISNDTLQLLPVLTPQQQAIISDRAKLKADEEALKEAQPAAPATTAAPATK